MKVSYKKLWVLCAERELSKSELRKRAGLSSATFTKLRKNQEVTLGVMLKIAAVLDCNAEAWICARRSLPTRMMVYSLPFIVSDLAQFVPIRISFWLFKTVL